MATTRKTTKKALTQEQKYIKFQKEMIEFMDLKEGDSVQVIKEVQENENGSNSCETYNTGEILTVEEICDDYIHLSDGCGYPVYALMKLTNSFKINDDYTAEIDDDGSVIVGCTTVEFDLLERIYKAAKEKNDEYFES